MASRTVVRQSKPRRLPQDRTGPHKSRVRTNVDPQFMPLVINFTAVPGVATGLHWLTTANPGTSTSGTATLTGSLLSAVTIGLTGMTWSHFGPRNKELRLEATATVGWMTGATTVLSAVGPWHWPWGMVWVAGGILTGGYWVIRDWARNLGKSHDEGEGPDGATQQVAGLAALAKAKVTKTQVSELGTASVRLALPRGETIQSELGGTAEAVASLADVPMSSVRIIPDPSTPRKGTLEIDTVDHLATPRDWPGGSAVGESIAVPVRAGYYASGADAVLDVTGCAHRVPSSHILATGMTGSGKTDAVAGGVVQEGLTRDDVDFLVLDVSKALQSYGHLAPHLWLESDEQRARAIMRRLRDVIKARTDHLGSKGLKQWAPGCGLRYLVLVLEEAYRLISDGKYDDVALAARSAGITIVTSLQRATFESSSTLWRGQHSVFWCHGTQNKDDASYGLPDTVQGLVSPEAWLNRRPGYSYLFGGGIEDEQGLRPIRSYRHDHIRDDIYRYLTGWRAHLGLSVQLDEVTAGAFGDLWDSRPVYEAPTGGGAVVITSATPPKTPAQRPAAQPAPEIEVLETPDPDAAEVAEDMMKADDELREMMRKAMAEELAAMPEAERQMFEQAIDSTTIAGLSAAGEDPDAFMRSADDDLPENDDLAEVDAELAEEGEDSRPRMGSGAVQSAWLDWVGARFKNGQTMLARAEAVEWAAERGRSDSWVDGKLRDLVKEGCARPADRGVVEITEAPPNPFGDLFGGAAA